MEWPPERIGEFKDRRNLTADALAEMLGVNRSYIFLLLNGERRPSKVLCRLLDCLDKMRIRK